MSARRQASTTSLTQYARTGSPVGQRGTLDFCNSFWGVRDQGFEVLSRRMRGAIHTTEELRNFWKERAAIEEDYAKRLSKLSKFVLGKDEVGDLRRSLDSVKDETDKQATFHLTLAQQIRTELETPCADFQTKQLHHKKTYLASIEKQAKAKQLQEQHVDKAREKYEQDCIKINSYTAQSSLVQGKDLEKIQLKLDRAKQTVQTNEREFANFTRAIESTVQKWEQDWKAFCDGCQDLEEARIDFMKDNMWSYANLVSTVCVADDESCERVRVSLEQMETEREIEKFVSVYGTGSQIPDPPAFVNYQLPDAIPSSASQPTFRLASFGRSSARDVPIQLHRNSTYISPSTKEEELINTAGRGAGGPGNSRRSEPYSETNSLARQPTQRNSAYGAQQLQQLHINGNTTGHSPSSRDYQNQNQSNGMPGPPMPPGASSSAVPLQRRSTNAASSSSQQPQSTYRPSPAVHDPHAEPIDPNAETYIKVGNHAYKVDPSKDPQMNAGPSGLGTGPSNRTSGGLPSAAKQNGVDPLQRQLEELQSGLSASGSNRRSTVHRGQAQSSASAGPSNENAVAGPSRHRTTDSLSVGQPSSRSPPANSPSPGAGVGAAGSSSQPVRDYRNSAELVVGVPPAPASRPASPNPPMANFMIPKNTTGPTGTEVVSEVLADYHQRLPGERKMTGGSTDRRASFVAQHMQNSSTTSANNAGPSGGHGHSLSVSSQQGPFSAGHAGIGAHGNHSRSNSPQPPSRGPSPGPGEIVNLGNITGPPQQQQQQRRNSYITPPSGGTPVRTTSPNPVGIALDPSGRVSHDEMAQRYQMQQQQQRGQTPLGHQPPTHQQAYGGIQQSQPPPQPPHQPPQQQQQQQQQRRTSWLAGAPAPGAPPAQPVYSPVTPPPPQVNMNMYQVQPPPTQQPQQGYVTPAPGQQGMYGQYSQQPPGGFPPQQQQQPQNAYAMVNNAIASGQQRPNSVNGYNGGSGSASQSSSSLTVRTGTMPGAFNRDPSPGPGPAVVQVGRSPSPQPPMQHQQVPQQVQQVHQMPPQIQQMQMSHQQPIQQQQQQTLPVSAYQSVQQQMQGQGQQGLLGQGRFSGQQQQQPVGQTTEDGTPILFYVKALYDYQATIDEEFDFQTNDIIAVTATPEDGWWSGELLDEKRRQRGRHIFPSNFVCLFY